MNFKFITPFFCASKAEGGGNLNQVQGCENERIKKVYQNLYCVHFYQGTEFRRILIKKPFEAFL